MSARFLSMIDISCRRISVLRGRPESISHIEVDAMLPVDVPEFRYGRQSSTFRQYDSTDLYDFRNQIRIQAVVHS